MCSAVLEFNSGKAALYRVPKHLGLEAGAFMLNYRLAADCDRIANISRKSTEKVKKRRKKLRAIKRAMRIKRRKRKEQIPMHQGHIRGLLTVDELCTAVFQRRILGVFFNFKT